MNMYICIHIFPSQVAYFQQKISFGRHENRGIAESNDVVVNKVLWIGIRRN